MKKIKIIAFIIILIFLCFCAENNDKKRRDKTILQELENYVSQFLGLNENYYGDEKNYGPDPRHTIEYLKYLKTLDIDTYYLGGNRKYILYRDRQTKQIYHLPLNLLSYMLGIGKNGISEDKLVLETQILEGNEYIPMNPALYSFYELINGIGNRKKIDREYLHTILSVTFFKRTHLYSRVTSFETIEAIAKQKKKRLNTIYKTKWINILKQKLQNPNVLIYENNSLFFLFEIKTHKYHNYSPYFYGIKTLIIFL